MDKSGGSPSAISQPSRELSQFERERGKGNFTNVGTSPAESESEAKDRGKETLREPLRYTREPHRGDRNPMKASRRDGLLPQKATSSSPVPQRP